MTPGAQAYAVDSGSKNEALTLDNTVLWQKNVESIETWTGPIPLVLNDTLAAVGAPKK